MTNLGLLFWFVVVRLFFEVELVSLFEFSLRLLIGGPERKWEMSGTVLGEKKKTTNRWRAALLYTASVVAGGNERSAVDNKNKTSAGRRDVEINGPN